MPEDNWKPRTLLPADLPAKWRDFVRCRRDTISVEPGELDWLPNMPPLTLTFESGPDGSITLRLIGMGGVINIGIPISVEGGRLTADTTDVPIPGEGANEWIEDFNADLHANGKQLSGASIRGGKLHLTKERIPADTSGAITTPTDEVHQPPLLPPPPPAHVTDPIPEPEIHQPPLLPPPPPAHVTDPIPEPEILQEPGESSNGDSESTGEEYSYPKPVDGEGAGQHHRFAPDQHHHVPDLSETDLPTPPTGISNEAMLELFNPDMTAENLEESARYAMTEEELDALLSDDPPSGAATGGGSGFFSKLPISPVAMVVGGGLLVLIVLAAWWAIAGGGTPSEDPGSAGSVSDSASESNNSSSSDSAGSGEDGSGVPTQAEDGADESGSVGDDDTAQVPPGLDPSAHVVGVEPVVTADGTQGFMVIFTQPWTGLPDLFSIFIELNLSVGECSTTASVESHAGTVNASGPWWLLDDGSVFIDTGCDINPGAPIDIIGRSGSWEDESTTQPVFADFVFRVEPDAVANAPGPFDMSRVVDNLGAAPIPLDLDGFQITGASNDGRGKITIDFKGPVKDLVEGDAHIVDIRVEASEGGIRVIATLRNIGGELIPNGSTINDADEVNGTIDGKRVDTVWEWIADNQIVVTMVSTEDVPIPSTVPNVTVTVKQAGSADEYTFTH